MSYSHTNDIIIPCQETSPNTFNISQEYFKEMSNFSCDKRARFLYIILKTDDKGNFISGYSGKKTADKISEANSYYGSSSDSTFFKKTIQANRHLYRFIVIGYCKSKEELGDSEDAINKYFKKELGTQWLNKNLGNGKYSTEGLISILKEDKNKKVHKKFIREEELDSYLSQGWSVRGHSTGLLSVFKENHNKFIREEELDFYLSQGWSKGTSIKGLISIVKNGIGKRIREEELDSYLSQGWEMGTCFIGLISIFKGNQNKFIREEELEFFLSDGWSKGTPLKGSICINKDGIGKRIREEELDSYLSQGWSKGNINKGLIGINKDGKEKRVSEEKLEFYLSDGWSKGRLDSLLTLKKDFEEHRINLERLEDIISYLKSDWKILLKTVHIHNKSLLRGTSIILSENNSYTRLIEFLEKGWVFGGLPKELVNERNNIAENKQKKENTLKKEKGLIKEKEIIVKEKRKKVLTEKDKENKRIAAKRPEVLEKQRIARIGRKWCNNGIEELWLFKEEFDLKLKEGWVDGRLKDVLVKIKEKKSTTESKQKRSIISQETQSNKPMLDLDDKLKLVHKDSVLEKLKLGWKLKLKKVKLWNPEKPMEAVYFSFDHSRTSILISYLELGYVFKVVKGVKIVSPLHDPSKQIQAMKETFATPESQEKRSKISTDLQAEKPMVDLDGKEIRVHKDSVLEKLKLGWKLTQTKIRLYNPETEHFVVVPLRGIEVNSANMIRKTIKLLEGGYVFGCKSRFEKASKEESVGEYCESRRMCSLF